MLKFFNTFLVAVCSSKKLFIITIETISPMKKHLPDILENVEGIKSINTETFREKMENLLLKAEKENTIEKQKTYFKEKEKEL